MRFFKKIFFLLLLGSSIAIANSPNNITLPSHLSYAHAYIDAGMYTDAIESLKKFNPKNPKENNELDYAFGKIYLSIDQPQKAMFYFDVVLDDAPKHYRAILGMANAQIKIGNLREAKKYISKAAESKKLKYEVSFLEALIDELTGNLGKAESHLIKVIDENRDSDVAVINYARLMLNRGQVIDVINYLSREQELKPKSAGIKSMLADALFAAKQNELAIDYKKQSIKLFLLQQEYESAQTALLVLRKKSVGADVNKNLFKDTPVGNKNKTQQFSEKSVTANKDKSSSDLVEEDPVPFSKAIINQKRIRVIPEKPSDDISKSLNKFPFPSGTAVTGGSGVVIDGGRKVITNRHVIENGKDFAVKNGLGHSSKAKVIHISKTDDLAILELDHPFGSEYSIAQEGFQKAKAGSDVVVMGYPLWYVLGTSTPSIANGVVAKGTGVNEDPTNFQLTAKINKGNSGGPVFDMYGNLIGITQGKLDSEVIRRGDGYAPEDINFAIHIDRAGSILGGSKRGVSQVKSTPMKSEDLYQAMIGKVVMVAVAID